MSQLAKTLLEDKLFERADKFKLLEEVSRSDELFGDLAILVAMRLKADEWGVYSRIASDIVRSAGLFPYLMEMDIGLRNYLATESYRSPAGRNKILHRQQYQVLAKLLQGESVILSAPTSFGKTFILEELLLSGKYNNVMVVVPSIALIEEIRRKVKDLKTPHKRISFAGQDFAEKNIFVLTQERAHDLYPNIRRVIGDLDLLVLDEFYKMDKSLLSAEEQKRSDRADLLSVVYREYSGISEQVYLLGPHIESANGYDTSRHQPMWIHANGNTTYLEIIQKTASKEKSKASIVRDILLNEREEVMVYCSSPGIIRELYLSELANLDEDEGSNEDLIAWISHNITEDWYIVDALRKGIGVHHGRLPRFISQEMIRRFGDGRIKILLCTSTVIEGVNTSAKSIVIYNNKKAFNAGYLTFKNISGRAGRMFQHFSGRVYCFEIPPANQEIVVNDPIGTEGIITNPSLLNLLEDENLSPTQKSDVEKHRSATTLPAYLLKQNLFIPIEAQEEVVSLLDSDPSVFQDITGPSLTRAQMIRILGFLDVLGLKMHSLATVSNARPIDTACWVIAKRIQAFLAGGVIELAQTMDRNGRVTDESLEDAFNFMRNQIGYNLPKYLRVLDRLQKYVYGDAFAGNLEPFANTLEFLNTEPVYIQLDELGVPIEFSKKYQLSSESIDNAARDIRRVAKKVEGFDGYIAKNFIDSY